MVGVNRSQLDPLWRRPIKYLQTTRTRDHGPELLLSEVVKTEDDDDDDDASDGDADMIPVLNHYDNLPEEQILIFWSQE